MADSGLQGRAAQALAELMQTQPAHDELVRRYQRNLRAYEAEIETRSDAQRWTHKLATAYAEHIVHTSIASMLDERLRFDVRPKPRLWNDSAELERALRGARAWQALLAHQLEQTRFDERQYELVLQERLVGFSPMKIYWRTSTRRKTRLSWDEQDGFPLLSQVEETDVAYDGPVVDVVDVRDFFWDDAASSVEDCGLIGHRIWVDFAQAKAFERAGVWKNVDALKESRDFSATLNERDRSPEVRRGRIEAFEIWRREDDGKIRVYTIGNRSVKLSERDHPFWHGEMPFPVFSSQRKLFRIPGRAQMDKLAPLQEQVWSFANQRLDSLELINNAVVLVREDMDDPESFQIYPGAVNAVSNPQDVQLWSPNPMAAQISIPAEEMLKRDMQNISGGFPFTSTSEARTVGANTATEASLTASISQQGISMAKVQLYYAYGRMGSQLIELNRQFTREPVYVQAVGLDTPEEQMEILPQMLEGEWLFSLRPMTESLLRQERRSEALAMFQTLLQSAQVNAMLAAQGFMAPLDWERVYRDLLEAYDKEPDAYFKRQQQGAPQLGQQQPGLPGQQQNGQGFPPQPAQGVTNPQLAAGMGAPSNQSSISPLAPMQQMFAAGSGAANA